MEKLKTILFIGPSRSGKSYLANLPFKEKTIKKCEFPTVGIDYRVHRINNTKYMIYDTGDLNRYYFIIKEYFSKVDEILVFVNTYQELENCKKKLESFKFNIISENPELNPDFLLSFSKDDLDFYKNISEESQLLEYHKKNKWYLCCFN